MPSKKGFTIVELLVVVILAALLLSTTVRGLGGALSDRSVRSARNSFEGIHARARAHAIERGSTVHLRVAEAGDSVWIEDGSEILEYVNFREVFGVDLVAYRASEIRLCMTARGFADTSCNSFTEWDAVLFYQGNQVNWTLILPLGQLAYPEEL
jgi:prepilin-type N-terminal cleavage/methylation domain-containing protein